MLIKQAIGGFCALAGVLFLTINAIILARGASKWGYDATERIAYGAVAATVPWVIASMPFLIHASWKPGKRTGRPSVLSLIGCGIWLVFVAYNLMGAAGSVALVREDVVSVRKHAASSLQADEEMRSRLTKEINAVSGYRPAGTVAPLLAAKKNSPDWDRTERCTDIRRPRDKQFCESVTALESELASAKRGEAINAQLAKLNEKLETKEAVSSNVDPQAAIISAFTGWDQGWIAQRMPLATPIVLELGSMTLIYFAFVLFGLSHKSVIHAPARVTNPVAKIAQPIAPPVALPAPAPAPAQASTLTRQRELAEWFFRECVRPASTGSMQEVSWFAHYQDVCKQHNDQPLPLASFRRFAERCECLTIQQIDGATYYIGALPYVPRRVA